MQYAIGVATVVWSVSDLVDGQYELAVRTVCVPSKTGNKKLDESLSAVISLTIDRTSPRAVQQASKPAGPYFPGDEISMAFDEDLDCTSASVTITMSDATVFNDAKLLVKCLNNKIFVDFASVVSVCFSFDFYSALSIHPTCCLPVGCTHWSHG